MQFLLGLLLLGKSLGIQMINLIPIFSNLPVLDPLLCISIRKCLDLIQLRQPQNISPTNPSRVQHMPSLNNPSTASHLAVRKNTCLAARNQPQNTEHYCTRQ